MSQSRVSLNGSAQGKLTSSDDNFAAWFDHLAGSFVQKVLPAHETSWPLADNHNETRATVNKRNSARNQLPAPPPKSAVPKFSYDLLLSSSPRTFNDGIYSCNAQN